MPSSSTTPAITDAGRKIGGARKDLWRERRLELADLDDMTPTEQYEHVVKDNVWPKPDWQALVAAGMPREVAAAVKVLRDGFAARPRKNTPEDRVAYIRMMGIVERRFMALRSLQEWSAAGKAIIHGDLDWDNRKHDPETRRTLFSIFKGRYASFSLSPAARLKVKEMIVAGWPDERPAVQQGRRANRRQDDGRQLPKRPHLDTLDRAGPDWRAGRSVAAEDFVEQFGFYGVEWGNWLSDAERQQVADMAYDALMDLAHVLGLPPRAMSLDGRLALAFGARGTGRAAAHYEPGRTVINLTRLSGAGSLAHEWAHAFDHLAGTLGTGDTSGKPRGGSGWYDRDYAPGARLPLLSETQRTAWDVVMDAAYRGVGMGMRRASAYYRNSVAISGANGYWARPTEMFARAFECAVFDRLHEHGRRSDYLVHSVEHERYDNPLFKGNPYPGGAEREQIGPRIFALVDAMAPLLAAECMLTQVHEGPGEDDEIRRSCMP